MRSETKKRWAAVVLFLGSVPMASVPVWGGDSAAKTAIGSGVGGAAGAVVGEAIGGKTGAIVGGAAGGAVGAAATTKGDGRTGAIVGGAVGGGAGAAIGQEVGGRNGAVVGAGLGGAAGAVVGREIDSDGKPLAAGTAAARAPAPTVQRVGVESDCGPRKNKKHPGKGWAKGHYKNRGC
jgi:hypothetical protein